MQVVPAPADAGISFSRTDLGDKTIHLSPRRSRGEGAATISRADHATTLSGEGFTISTVEHLMAALRGLGVDNAHVRLSGDEVPIMDGSAAPFVYLLEEAGLKDQGVPRQQIALRRPLEISDGDREIAIYPADSFRVTYTIDFTHPAIGRQSLSAEIDERTFVDGIAPARTFCLLKDVEELRRRGLALGGSLDNAVVVGDGGPLNGLRYHDEFVRHKVLDLVGDLALMGHPIMGHVVAHKAGHQMHSLLVRELMAHRDAWSLISAEPVLAGVGVLARAPMAVANG